MSYNMNDIIYKKREGGKLSKDEIEYFIKGYVAGDIPDYQASALLMAIFFRGLDREETFQLTNAMRYSGDTIDLSSIKGVKVDKHSTGASGVCMRRSDCEDERTRTRFYGWNRRQDGIHSWLPHIA